MNASTSDSDREINSDATEDENLISVCRSKLNDSKTSPKVASSKFKIPNKLDTLTYQDIQISDTNDSVYALEHKLAFDPPLYQKPEFEVLPLKEQVKMLCAYHTFIARNITKHARTMLESVPSPKPIVASTKCYNSLRKDEQFSEEEISNNIDPFDTLLESSTDEYISRSGRVTKRKLYTENVPAASNDMKKLKVIDEDWEAEAKPSTSRTPNRTKNTDTDLKTTMNKNISKKNLEIMSRSPLFRGKDTRIAKIAEGVEQKTYKDKVEEKKIEIFKKSLDDNDDFIETVHSDSEDSNVRQRVEPPSLKGKRGKGRKVEPVKTTQKGKPNQKEKKQSPDSSMEDVFSSSTSKKQPLKKMVKCPICNREYGTKEIEEHASSCGENFIPTRSHNSGPLSSVCPHCDKFIVDGDQLSKHIKHCSSK